MSADLNAGFRKMLLVKGQALPPKTPGGPPRFPIAKPADVKDAVGLVGQVPDAEKAKVKAHIVKCAKKVGGTQHIPTNW